jgi:putative ABC transport system permease protein
MNYMFKNYFVSAIRNLINKKTYSFINIFGLSLGITASLLILTYVNYEVSFDKFLPNNNNVYRVVLEKYQENELVSSSAYTYSALSAALKENFPEVKASTRIGYEECLMVYGEKKLSDQKVYWVDSSFLNVIQLPLLKGNPSEQLTRPNTTVISESSAFKFFGNKNPIGETILLNEGLPFLITGVFANIPSNSHMKVDFLLSLSTGYSAGWASASGDWKYNWTYTYFVLEHNTDYKEFEKKLQAQIKNIEPPKKAEGSYNVYKLQPIKSIHLHSNLTGELQANGNIKKVYFFSVIAFLILVIAWINFVNLSTARAIERSKETGIRKVSGASKKQLIQQFLFESLITNLLAIIVAFILLQCFMPWFSQIINKPINLAIWQQPFIWIAFLIIFISGSLLSGIYPAFVLSSFQPLQVLKSKSGNSVQGNLFRHILVVIQFLATILLMTGTFAIYMQVKHMQNANLNINTSQVISIKAPRTLNLDTTKAARFLSFKEQVSRYHTVKYVSASNPIPGEEIVSYNDKIYRLGDGNTNKNMYSIASIDYDYIPLFGLQMLAGRNYNTNYIADKQNIIINETAAKILGFKTASEAINEKIVIDSTAMTIIGVVNDYRQEGMKKTVSPTLYCYNYDYLFGYNSIKVSEANISSSLQFLKELWDKNFPKDPFVYFFVDKVFEQHYNEEKQMNYIFGMFSLLAVIIVCLGLFGLISYITSLKIKEIGIRKVLGASIPSLIILLTKDFIKLIIMSLLIGIPLAYIIINQWLLHYPYRVDLNAFMFIVPIVTLLLTAIITVVLTVIRVAYSTTVSSLRYE